MRRSALLLRAGLLPVALFYALLPLFSALHQATVRHVLATSDQHFLEIVQSGTGKQIDHHAVAAAEPTDDGLRPDPLSGRTSLEDCPLANFLLSGTGLVPTGDQAAPAEQAVTQPRIQAFDTPSGLPPLARAPKQSPPPVR